MIIRRLELQNFRNYRSVELQFEGARIALYGPNGAGKTSILEAINLLAISKSFLPVKDGDLVRHGADGYRIAAEVLHDVGSTVTIDIEYTRTAGKRITTSATGPCSAHQLIGFLPCVVLASIHRELFIGEPAVRRSFVDRILSIASAAYKDALWRQRIALHQRNRLLSTGSYSTSELEAWTAQLLTASAEMLWHRRAFTAEFNEQLRSVAPKLLPPDLVPTLVYHCPWLGADAQPTQWEGSFEAFSQRLAEHIAHRIPLDIERLSTQWGPQRDVFSFCVGDGHELASVCSQGQQKVALYAIKVAEASYLHTATGRAPVVLLDDVVSDLDAHNAARIESSVISCAQRWQTFITTQQVASLHQPSAFHCIAVGSTDVAHQHQRAGA